MTTQNLSLLAFALFAGISLSAQQNFTGNEADALCKGSKTVTINRQSRVPAWITFREDSRIATAAIQDVLRPTLKMNLADGWRSRMVQKDELGFTHERFSQTYNGVRVEGGEYIVHSKAGVVQTANGMWFDGITVNTTPGISKDDAVAKAMVYVNAAIYKWQIPSEEARLKYVKNNPDATYYPGGELVIVCRNGDIMAKDYVLAWKLDIFAAEPMSRQWIYIDAATGAVVHTKNRIHHADVAATGNTMYSGTQSFTCDQVSANSYRLRETGRGMGIRTFNMQNTTNYTLTDFTNSSATWTSTANDDHCALDAHWGAEGTYDFYMLEMNRNGLDGNGMQMDSYVHYSTNYNNAFWNGDEMTYGDGSGTAGGFNPLTAIDVCAHEFTHGVTEFSSNLDYQDESGALNESFSDIFGAAIEHYKKPATANFLIGEEITVSANTALRSMSNPNQFGDPDCYGGTNWYTGTADNGGVHTNSGVQNFWYYLCSVGGNGTNDLGDAYSITGFGWYDASRVAFRNNTFYLVNTSEYMDSRAGAIQSAIDIFGACTPEVEDVTNAWYACGVGPQYSASVTAAFNGDVLTSCSVPTTVNFTNTSVNGTTALWDFGDNTTDTAYNPTHVYSAPGTYNVQLTVSSACGTNTVLQNSYIAIATPAAPVGTGTQICTPGSVTLNATAGGTMNWFTQPTGGTAVATGGTYTTPSVSTTTTYYVENVTPQAPANVGPPSYNFGTGGQHNNTSTQYLEFTVYQNCTLSTAEVNAGSAGNKTFTLWDGQGNQLNQYTVNVPATGVQTVTLNIPLTPGQYRIGGTQMNLYRNQTGANYPYTTNGVASITGSSAGGNYYYYLYDWVLTLDGCHSSRTPVTVVVGPSTIQYDASAYDSVCVETSVFALTGGMPAGGTYSGPGVSGGNFDPQVAGAGMHTITYTYTDSAGCTGTATQQVWVDLCLGISSALASPSMSVYPNPAESDFTVEFSNAGTSNEATLTVVNMLGQTVHLQQMTCTSGVNRWQIDAAHLAPGIYFVNITTTEGIHSRKLEIQ